ncbi:N-acetylglucosamine kinase [Nonomuraea sp. NPDC003707]
MVMLRNPVTVLGIDVGGSSSRCVMMDTAGKVAGRGNGDGASVLSSADPRGAILTAVRGALGDFDPALVGAVTVGAAAAGPGLRNRVLTMLQSALSAARVSVKPVLVTDIESAYASAAPAPEGVILLAGTGAVGALFSAGRMVRRSDGLGWLVGDAGSAVWQGRRAVKAVLEALDERRPPTALTEAISRELGFDSGGDVRQELVAWAHEGAPARLGRLAPIVARLASWDDAAASIVDDAVRELLDTVAPLLRVAPAGCAHLVGGSVLLADNPTGRRVRAELARIGGAEPILAKDPAVGAAILALRHLGQLDPAVHANLVRSAGSGEG